MKTPDATAAPELDVTEWLNSGPLTLEGLRGRVVLIEAFQMLCPDCVNQAIPQASKVRRAFPEDQLTVIGLHTVFEHHEVTDREALEVFCSEFGVRFPVGIDRHDDPGSPIPSTMRRYGLQGTPSQILIDRAGRLRALDFGAVDDLVVGARIGQLLAEPVDGQVSD